MKRESTENFNSIFNQDDPNSNQARLNKSTFNQTSSVLSVDLPGQEIKGSIMETPDVTIECSEKIVINDKFFEKGIDA